MTNSFSKRNIITCFISLRRSCNAPFTILQLLELSSFLQVYQTQDRASPAQMAHCWRYRHTECDMLAQWCSVSFSVLSRVIGNAQHISLMAHHSQRITCYLLQAGEALTALTCSSSQHLSVWDFNCPSVSGCQTRWDPTAVLHDHFFVVIAVIVCRLPAYGLLFFRVFMWNSL